MSFLSPGALWLLPLAAAPLVLHMLSARRARRVVFSDLSLLREARRLSLPSARLRQWLILAARCLALAALFAAAARPVMRGGPAAAAAESGMDLVVLLDTSWSMRARDGGRTRFESARESARAAAAFAGSGDRVAAGGASAGLDAPLAFAASAAQAQEALSRLSPSWRASDLAAAAAGACRFLAAAPPAPGGARRRRVLAVFSDGAAQAVSGFGRGLPADCPPETVLVGLEAAGPLPNAALLDASSPDGRSLLARGALYGGVARQASVDLSVREARVGRAVLPLAPGAAASASLTLPAAKDPETWGRVELPADALEADDSWTFALRREAPPRVLLLAGSPRSMEAGGGGYALRALLGDGARLPYRLDAADLGRFAQLDLSGYAAVVVDSPKGFPPGAAAGLARFVEDGGGLWLVAGPEGAVLGPELERALPGLLGAEVDAGSAGIRPDAAPAEGPERFGWDEFELARVALGRRRAVDPRPGAAVWFRDASGAPLLLAGERGRGRVLLWAGSLEVGWTNLALKPFFAGWADAGLRWLTRFDGRSRWRSLKVGEPLARDWDPGERAPATVTLVAPDGRRTALLVKGRRAEYPDTREPGLYRLEWEGDGRPAAEAWAVNVDRSTGEGDLTPAPRLPWAPLRAGALREDFDRAVSGREARTALLTAAAALLLAEAFLAAPRRPAGPAARRREAAAA